MTELIGREMKYFSRMTEEARRCLAAASLAMRAAGMTGTIGILGCGFDGWLAADLEYFRDYVTQGRSLGRANLFIYTLPSSALSEVAIALSLNGPTLHIHSGVHPVRALIDQAKMIVENREADGILCVWSDGKSAVCVAVGFGIAIKSLNDFDIEATAAELSQSLPKAFP